MEVPVATTDSVPPSNQRPSPGRAFLRSLVVPGWGQAASGAYSRAIFYAVAEAASGTMLLKSHQFLNSARDGLARQEADARRRAGAVGIFDADSVAAFLGEDAGVVSGRALIDSRSQQREDWIAFGLFMLLLGGADAFVSAHLSDFPEPLTVNPVPGQPGGPPAVEVGIRLPVSWGASPRD